MNLTEAKYKDFALVKEMLQTCDIIRRFDFAQADETARVIQETGRLFLTGEGSSRIFPGQEPDVRGDAAGHPAGRGHRRGAAGP